MADTVVMKFGGTSVRDAAACGAALAHVRRQVDAGRRVAVVVSAMGRQGEPYATDTLIGLLVGEGEPVDPRELDLALSVGEVLSAARFAHLLSVAGIAASAFTGQQAGVLVEPKAGAAEILAVNPERIEACLAGDRVAVVAGFQGADAAGEIRTLGRGGSDTSAVALGAALGATEVEIYTDVDGIADADPRRVPNARYLDRVGASRLLALAEEGSKVLHHRAVAAALPGRTPLRVRNTFGAGAGTLVHHEPESGEPRPLALAHRDGLLLLDPDIGEVQPRDVVPELVAAGGTRWLLPDDVRAAERLAALSERLGELRREPGWATASLVWSAEASGPAPPAPAGAESLPSRPGVQRFLVREENLEDCLRALHGAIAAAGG